MLKNTCVFSSLFFYGSGLSVWALFLFFQRPLISFLFNLDSLKLNNLKYTYMILFYYTLFGFYFIFYDISYSTSYIFV
jgi:hypothetical protein